VNAVNDVKDDMRSPAFGGWYANNPLTRVQLLTMTKVWPHTGVPPGSLAEQEAWVRVTNDAPGRPKFFRTTSREGTLLTPFEVMAAFGIDLPAGETAT